MAEREPDDRPDPSGSFGAPPVAAGSLLRPRLIAALAARFESRLVKVVAPAGFGKTTAVAHAIEQNQLSPSGVDIWVPVSPKESVKRLLGKVGRAIGGPDHPAATPSVADIADRVWAHAPKEVCLVFDDVHHGVGSLVEDMIAELVEALPDNGHVLVTSRHEVTLASAARIGAGEVNTLGVADLEFTDSDLIQLGELSDIGQAASVSERRWPVLLALARRAGPAEQARYLSEELLVSVGPERAEQLASIGLVGKCDPEIFAAMWPDSSATLDEVVEGLPLVSRFDSSTVRLHDLWLKALEGVLNAERKAQIQARAAAVLQDRGAYAAALEICLDADDLAGARRAAVGQAGRPLLGQDIDALQRCRGLLDGIGMDVLHQVFVALEVASVSGGITATPELEKAVAMAEEAGDVEVVALIVYRMTQTSVEQTTRLAPSLARVVDGLRGHDFAEARVAVAHADIVSAMADGALAEVQAGLDVLERIGTPVAEHIRARVLHELGRPEDIINGGGYVPEGTEAFWGYAMWLRGDVSPDDAVGLADYLLTMTASSALVARISTFGKLPVLACAAGDYDRARAFIQEVDNLAPLARRQATFSHTGRAALALAGRDEAEARRQLEAALELSPIDNWLYRAYLMILPAVYTLVPEVRERLDGFEFGPALCSVIDWSRALVELRGSGRTSLVSPIDFSKSNFLRAHFSPPLLTELVVAGAIEGSSAAVELLGQIPETAANLQLVAERYRGSMRQHAKRLMRQYPAPPAGERRLLLFGNLRFEVDGVAVDNADWRRSRVQELLAWLFLNRNASRSVIAAALWPDIPEAAAQNNLRVQLSHLHRLLEPGRDKNLPPWFVRSEGDYIMFESRGFGSDLEDFDIAWKRALDADRSGAPTLALQGYHEAVGHYAGDLLGSLPDADWVIYDRIERRTRATTSLIRIAELNSARGEPELASEMATRALRIDPLSQRAARMLIQGLRATGDNSGARRAFRELMDLLRRHDEPSDPETRRLSTQLGLTVDGTGTA